MPKTTVTIEHRDYVPYGWVAKTFCNVDFRGFRSEELKKKWQDIQNNRYLEYSSTYNQNEIEIQNLHKQIEMINLEKQFLINSKPSKPFYRFWYTKAEKKKLFEINTHLDKLSHQSKKLALEASALEKENANIGNKRTFRAFECHQKIENLLKQNGFVLTRSSSNGIGCVTKTEVWTLEE